MSLYGTGEDEDVEGLGDDLEEECDDARLSVSLGTVNSCEPHEPSAKRPLSEDDPSKLRPTVIRACCPEEG